MENDETTKVETDETEVETKDVETGEVEETSDEGTGESDTTDTSDSEGAKLTYEQKLERATTPEEKFAIADAEANKNRRLLRKASKPDNAAAPKPKASSKPTTEPSVEETVLRANGMPNELLSHLKKVANLNGTSLLDAQKDPIFVAVKDKFDKEVKRKQASLGAGRGAGGKKSEKTFTTPGISRDEHKEMFYGRVRA